MDHHHQKPPVLASAGAGGFLREERLRGHPDTLAAASFQPPATCQYSREGDSFLHSTGSGRQGYVLAVTKKEALFHFGGNGRV